MGELEVFFGGGSLVCRNYQITDRINGVPEAVLHFNKSEFLGLGAINYLDDVFIDSVVQKKRVFTGNIVSIQEEPDNQVLINLLTFRLT